MLWNLLDYFSKRPINGVKVVLPNGMPLFYNHEDWTSRTIYEGTYERELLTLLKHFQCETLYVDAGANLGVTLWHAMYNSSITSRWIAFEPSARCHKQLNNLCNALKPEGSLMRIGLSNKSGESSLFGSNNPNHSGVGTLRIEPSSLGDSVPINVTRLDEVISANNPSSKISMLKIDTEGHEGEVLSGAKDLVLGGKISNFIIEVSPMFGSTDYLAELDADLPSKYKWFEIRESGYFRKKPKLIETEPEICRKNKLQFNLLITSEREKFSQFI